MFRFPFSNYQELNLDWILAKVKEFAELIPGMREVLDKSEQAITTANEAKEIAQQPVTTEKLAADAVTGDKIADGSITNAMLSSDFTFEKGMEMDLLWTNPSTSSPFQAQTISMKCNTNNYKYLMLLMTNPNNGYSLYTIVSGGINSVECIGGFSEASAPAICYRRTVNPLNTMATFSTCVGKNISTGIILDSPEIMIPLSIYGLK